MRKILVNKNGERKEFKATYVRTGKRINFNGYSEETILLTNIIDVETNQVVTDHLWFNFTKGFEKLVLTEGVLIAFEARVKKYEKGYVNKHYKINRSETDYKLSHPTKIRLTS